MFPIIFNHVADFQKLFNKVLVMKKQELDEASLKSLIKEKKEKVGGGYLTDQGALFLVASDQGVSLEQVSNADLTLDDLYIGANEITVVGKVFAIYPSKEFNRKDGSGGKYRRFILRDSKNFVQVNLWDEKVDLIQDIKADIETPLRIVKGYVKSGLDGKPVLNLGRNGSIELTEEVELTEKISKLEEIAKDVSQIKHFNEFLVVDGKLLSNPKISNFTRDQEDRTVLQFRLGGLNGGQDVRVAIWNGYQNSINTSINSIVRLTNVRSKVLPDGTVEIHGNEGTKITILEEITTESGLESTVENNLPKKVRVLSKDSTESGNEVSLSLLVVDGQKLSYTLVARGDAILTLEEIKVNDVINCYGRDIGGSVLICEDSTSIRLCHEDEKGFPGVGDLLTRLVDIKETSTPIFTEVIALSKADIRDMRSTDDVYIKKGELLVGDDTGEARLEVWRELTNLIIDIVPGQRLRLMKVLSNRFGQTISLQIKSYSRVEKINPVDENTIETDP